LKVGRSLVSTILIGVIVLSVMVLDAPGLVSDYGFQRTKQGKVWSDDFSQNTMSNYAVSVDGDWETAASVSISGGVMSLVTPRTGRDWLVQSAYVRNTATVSDGIFSVMVRIDGATAAEGAIRTGVQWRDLGPSPRRTYKIGFYNYAGGNEKPIGGLQERGDFQRKVNLAVGRPSIGAWNLVKTLFDGTSFTVKWGGLPAVSFSDEALSLGYVGVNGQEVRLSIDDWKVYGRYITFENLLSGQKIRLYTIGGELVDEKTATTSTLVFDVWSYVQSDITPPYERFTVTDSGGVTIIFDSYSAGVAINDIWGGDTFKWLRYTEATSMVVPITSTTLYATEDSYVNERNDQTRNTNYGGANPIYQSGHISDLFPVGECKIYLKFPTPSIPQIPSIPQGIMVTRATVYIYIDRIEIGTNVRVYLYTLSRDWSEYTITWNNQPTVSSIAGSTMISSSIEGTWLAIPISTNVVYAWIGGSNYGLSFQTESWPDGIYQEPENLAVRCHSREGANPPHIVIEYSPAPATITTTTTTMSTTVTYSSMTITFIGTTSCTSTEHMYFAYTLYVDVHLTITTTTSSAWVTEMSTVTTTLTLGEAPPAAPARPPLTITAVAPSLMVFFPFLILIFMARKKET
jgi:hypothetical protein